MKQKFAVEGMSCAACQAHVQKAVEKVVGVHSVNVNLLKNDMVVEFDSPATAENIIDAVKKAGYSASLPNEKKQEAKKDNALLRLIASGIILVILMYFSMGNMMWGFPAFDFVDHEKSPLGFALLQLLLVIPIIYLNRNYFYSGYKKLLRGKPNMDSLIAIGATASMLYGIFALFMMAFAEGRIAAGETGWRDTLMSYHDSLYFESAGMILTLVSLGKYLEGLSKKRTEAAVAQLIAMAPDTATLLIDGREVQIPAKDVKVGDIVIVKNGDRIPVDGEIIEGSASIDQANITGESVPVFKGVGEEVFSSTTLTAGYIKLSATKVGEDTSFSKIIKLVDEASNSKAPISKLADKISGVFVPCIFAVSLVTLVANLIAGATFERALNFAITVVVIACPCALGLATPVAIMAGTGKGAQNGLLIKNAEVLEKAHLIRTVALDKTGTITVGKPKVTDYLSFSDDKTLDCVYSLEKMSEHPLAGAITEYALEQGAIELDVDDFKAVAGEGVTGKIDGVLYGVGNLRLAQDLGADSSDIEEKSSQLSKEGKTTLLIIKRESEDIDGAKIVGLIAVKDEVKPGSIAAVRELVKRGTKVIMLTGDNRSTAEAIAKEVGVSEVIAEVYPEDKQKVINSLKSDPKHIVAMVGDGVNDAPALAAADLSIAIGGGSDVAIKASDIVLLRNDLLDVLNVIELSRRTINTIRLGLFWAFFYNIICVVIATGAFSYIDPKFVINPMIGSIAMSISSVSVVLNALTINLFKVRTSSEHIASDTETAREEAEGERNLSSQYNNENSQYNEENNVGGDSVDNNMEVKDMSNLEITLKVKGMMCSHCTNRVEKACLSVEGVLSAAADLQKGEVRIVAAPTADIDKVIAAIEESGYEVEK